MFMERKQRNSAILFLSYCSSSQTETPVDRFWNYNSIVSSHLFCYTMPVTKHWKGCSHLHHLIIKEDFITYVSMENI